MNWIDHLTPEQATPPKELVRHAPRKGGQDFGQFLDQALREAGPQQVAAVSPGKNGLGLSRQAEGLDQKSGGRGPVAKRPGAPYNYVGV